jgi:hypothetical protein
LIVKTSEPADIEAPPPLTDDLAWHIEAGSDAVVAKPLARQEDDFSPHNVTMR